MYISLLFDVEDIMTPESDDTAKDLAGIVTDHGFEGDFLVVGDKARKLVERQRGDVIAALGRHRIGLHTNRHSWHPTVAEYLEDKGWDDGITEAIRREGPGVETIRQVFKQNPSCWGESGSSWGPQIHPAMQRLGVPAVIYPETGAPSADLHWYAGSLTFGYRHRFAGFDRRYSNDNEFQAHLQKLQGAVDDYVARGFTWMCLFCGHPIYIRAYQFGDALNLAHGKNTPPEQWQRSQLMPDADYATALKNFSLLLDYLKADARLHVASVGALTEKFGRVQTEISAAELVQYAEAAASLTADISIDDRRLSPAEAVAALLRGILALASGQSLTVLPIRYVDGPISLPPALAGPITVPWDTFHQACLAAKAAIDKEGRLPAAVAIGGQPVGIGSFFRALCAAFVALSQGQTPMAVTLHPGAQLPLFADDIARRTEEGYRNWVIHKPDLDTTNLITLTRLQCWTIKPARA